MSIKHPGRPSTQVPSNPRSGQGWTLIELLIAVAVVGVLASLALPTYQQQQRQVRRSDGHAALLQLQSDQARWRSTHASHADSLNDLGWTSDRSPLGHYQIRLTEANAEGYAGQAIAVGGQSADRDCTPLRLTWKGSANAIFGAGEYLDRDPNRCWRR